MNEVEEKFIEMLQRGHRRKGLKLENGEWVHMTPQEFSDYLRPNKTGVPA